MVSGSQVGVDENGCMDLVLATKQTLWCCVVVCVPALLMSKSSLDSVFRNVSVKLRTDFRLARSKCT